MKFRQEFRVPEPLSKVWLFFEQPLRVAECIPGFEKAVPLEDDSYSVRATQKLGPMSATFEARIRITEQIHEERIEFTATGKAVRGAVGNFRSQNTVILTPSGDETDVVVEGEAALAGVLGTVASSIINKQVAKVTAEFASNLERKISGGNEPEPQPNTALPKATITAAAPAPQVNTQPQRDPWAKAAAILSAAAVIIGLVILWRISI
jgi:carbon monoxide dehydrogenase subunit G